MKNTTNYNRNKTKMNFKFRLRHIKYTIWKKNRHNSFVFTFPRTKTKLIGLRINNNILAKYSLPFEKKKQSLE